MRDHAVDGLYDRLLMTHTLDREVINAPLLRREDDGHRRRATRASVFSSAGLLLTSSFELAITVPSDVRGNYTEYLEMPLIPSASAS